MEAETSALTGKAVGGKRGDRYSGWGDGCGDHAEALRLVERLGRGAKTGRALGDMDAETSASTGRAGGKMGAETTLERFDG
jgi:hypothetical protein